MKYRYLNEFFENEYISKIKDKEKWTTSGNDKKPLNINHLLNILQYPGIAKFNDEGNLIIYGNTERTSKQLTSLTNLYDKFDEFLPTSELTHFVYWLDVMDDNYIVLDIEPRCSVELSSKFLKLPYLYAETSMSGKGYHLLFEKPKNFDDFDIAKSKVKFQSKGGDYEILLNHWCTFTGKKLPDNENPEGSIEDLFEELVKVAIEKEVELNERIDIDKTAGFDSIENLDSIVDHVLEHSFDKLPSDFTHSDNTNDASRYEFNTALHYGKVIKKLDKKDFAKKETKEDTNNLYLQNLENKRSLPSLSNLLNPTPYTKQEQALILYKVLTEVLEYRPKHNTLRNGIPLLYNIAVSVISGYKKKEKKEENENE